MPHGSTTTDEHEVRKYWVLLGPDQTWSGGFVRLGLFASILFTALIIATPFFPDMVRYIHKWTGYGYIVIQMVALLSRNHLSNAQVWRDHIFSFIPVLTAFGITIVLLIMQGAMPASGWEALNWFHAIAWFDFVFGIAIASVILNSPYQREENIRT